jgi:hypothetical protein
MSPSSKESTLEEVHHQQIIHLCELIAFIEIDFSLSLQTNNHSFPSQLWYYIFLKLNVWNINNRHNLYNIWRLLIEIKKWITKLCFPKR